MSINKYRRLRLNFPAASWLRMIQLITVISIIVAVAAVLTRPIIENAAKQYRLEFEWCAELDGAAITGSLAEVNTLLKQRSPREGEGGWALMCAAQYGHAKIVSALLRAGVNPNVQHSQSGTPLIWALQENHLKVADKLLQEGAKVNFPDNEGTTPLEAAITKNNLHGVRLLLRHGASLDTQDNRGNTPLWQAVDRGNLQIVRLLLERGADINARGEWNSVIDQALVNFDYYKGNPSTRAVIAALLAKKSQIKDPKEITRLVDAIQESPSTP